MQGNFKIEENKGENGLSSKGKC
ncbi:uncharacterized protein METZ01_LOCUS329597 [marine metagenome]|uniref:Uncharacterized protein n=1 Tax=marine metagenome TaxID=408172 RepID=A0A382PTM1_9ZZZZ